MSGYISHDLVSGDGDQGPRGEYTIWDIVPRCTSRTDNCLPCLRVEMMGYYVVSNEEPDVDSSSRLMCPDKGKNVRVVYKLERLEPGQRSRFT